MRASNEAVDLRAAEIDKNVHNEEEINDPIDDKEVDPSADHHLARRRVEIDMLLTQETDLRNACMRACVHACMCARACAPHDETLTGRGWGGLQGIPGTA